MVKELSACSAVPDDLSAGETTAQRLRRAAERLVDLRIKTENRTAPVAFAESLDDSATLRLTRFTQTYPPLLDHLRTTAEIIEDETAAINAILDRLAI